MTRFQCLLGNHFHMTSRTMIHISPTASGDQLLSFNTGNSYRFHLFYFKQSLLITISNKLSYPFRRSTNLNMRQTLNNCRFQLIRNIWGFPTGLRVKNQRVFRYTLYINFLTNKITYLNLMNYTRFKHHYYLLQVINIRKKGISCVRLSGGCTIGLETSKWWDAHFSNGRDLYWLGISDQWAERYD